MGRMTAGRLTKDSWRKSHQWYERRARDLGGQRLECN